MLLVDDGHDGQPEFFLRAPRYLVDGGGAFAVAHHEILLLVDAFPVDEENLAGLYALALVELVEHHRAELARFAEGIFEAQIALDVELARRKPYEGALTEAAVDARAQLVDDIGQRAAGHHRLAGTCRRLEHYLAALAAEVEELHRLVGELGYGILLVFYGFHSSST